MTAWIRMLSDDEADKSLLEALRLARTPHGTVDNVMRAHSLRPSTMKGHMALYKAVLHDGANELPLWFQETIAAYVSVLNGCSYSYDNHWANARHLIRDSRRAGEIETALKKRSPDTAFSGGELALLRYAEKLTLNPTEMIEEDIGVLRKCGIDDGRILEANQIVCYFNYVNRMLNGLGVTTKGDVVGFYANA